MNVLNKCLVWRRGVLCRDRAWSRCVYGYKCWERGGSHSWTSNGQNIPQLTRGEKAMNGKLIKPVKIRTRRKETTTKSTVNCKSKVRCNNKVLLCSTGNYIQYSVTNHNGKEYEKEYIYISIYKEYIYIYIYR